MRKNQPAAKMPEPTPEELHERKIKSLRFTIKRGNGYMKRRLEAMVETASGTLAKWHANFLQNPASAFECSTDAFDASAALDLARSLLASLEHNLGEAGRTEADVAAFLQKRALEEITNRARYGTHKSTSFASNSMEESKTKAWATVLEIAECAIDNLRAADEARAELAAMGVSEIAHAEAR